MDTPPDPLLDALKPFPLDDLVAFYPEATSRDARAALQEERKLTRRVRKRQFLDKRMEANAAKSLASLPKRGESYHIIMAGCFDMWHFVPAVLRLAAPATIAWLGLATLGFNRQGIENLFKLMDAKQVAAVDFLCSCYFKSVDQDVFSDLYTGLADRGQHCAAVRTHCKLLLFELSDGRSLVIESSANLRSSRCLEQMSLTHDAALLDFHRTWMREVIANAPKE